jgi:hypothetical protein
MSTQAEPRKKSKGDWMRNAFVALVGADRLAVVRCLQANAAIAGLSLLSTTVFLLLPASTPAPVSRTWATAQLVLSALILAATATVYLFRQPARAYLFVMGLVFTASVVAYSVWFFVVARTFHGGRMSHAPGILALWFAYAIRLVTDFGPLDDTFRGRWIVPVSWGALIAGGAMDVTILIAMFVR